MMKIGTKIYYEKSSGNIILIIGERFGDVKETTQAQDFKNYKVLAERVPETVGMIQLEYNQYKQDFAEGFLDHVDPETKQLYFRYLDPDDPDTEPRPPLSVEVDALKQENTLLKAQNTALSERADFIEDCIAEMALQVYQ